MENLCRHNVGKYSYFIYVLLRFHVFNRCISVRDRELSKMKESSFRGVLGELFINVGDGKRSGGQIVSRYENNELKSSGVVRPSSRFLAHLNRKLHNTQR